MDSRQLRILLVEDDEDDFILLKHLLSDIEGIEFVLEWANTYEAALETLEKKCHDIYLFDYCLGRANGLDLLRTAIAKGCKVPEIVLTGQGERATDLEAMRAEAADYLVKGKITPSLLERSIRYAIHRAETFSKISNRSMMRPELPSGSFENSDNRLASQVI